MAWVANTLHTTSERGVSSITTADAHTSAASSRLNWRPCQIKWSRPFRRKTKSSFCASVIIFQSHSSFRYGSRTVISANSILDVSPSLCVSEPASSWRLGFRLWVAVAVHVFPVRNHGLCYVLNLLKPNDIYIYIYIYICRTAALTSRRYILNIYSTNIHTEYFKHAA